jgi:hypothetical protein
MSSRKYSLGIRLYIFVFSSNRAIFVSLGKMELVEEYAFRRNFD